MALTPEDFTEPEGDLQEAMFPKVDLPTYVQVWLSDAQERTTGEDAQRAWVYHRAYSHVANRMNNEPAQADVEDKGSVQRLVSQMQSFQDKADSYKAEFERQTEEQTGYVARSQTVDSNVLW